MNSRHPKMVIAGGVVITLLLLIVIGCFVWRDMPNRVKIPDEKKAGTELLAEKLTGPGYFTRDGAVEENGSLWIGRDHVMEQFDRVVRERRFGPENVEKLKSIIRRLAEPQSSRLVVGERVNLVRLNLALDELRE